MVLFFLIMKKSQHHIQVIDRLCRIVCQSIATGQVYHIPAYHSPLWEKSLV